MTRIPGTTRVLYLIAYVAGPTKHIDDDVRAAQAADWDTCLILTPAAVRRWRPRKGKLEELTGHPARPHYKLPGQIDTLPTADAMLIAPLSCTSVHK